MKCLPSLDIRMLRSVGLSLLGLGLCLATGCAGIGSSRALGLAERGASGRNKSKSNSVNVSSSAPNSEDVVTFQAPKRRWAPSGGEAAADSFIGHSPESKGHVHPAGHVENPTDSTEPTIAAKHAVSEAEVSGDSAIAIVPTGIRSGNASKPSNHDLENNAIELQGLEAFDSPSPAVSASDPLKPLPWSSRPQASEGSQKDVASTAVATANEGGKIQQVRGENLPTAPPGPWQVELERLIARAERDVAGMPTGSNATTNAEHRRRQVYLRLLYLMARHPEQSLTAIPSLEPAEQEYWQQMVWAMARSLDAEQIPLPGERAVQVITPLNTALRRLREQADLTLTNTAICEEISYFGNYKRFPRNEFVPGQPVLFYTEIENFRSELTASGEYRTLLRSIIEVFDSEGRIRWKKTFAATEDLCRNPRRDYFHNYQFTIPERLALGPHTLKLTVVDDLSGKQTTCSVRFLVK